MLGLFVPFRKRSVTFRRWQTIEEESSLSYLRHWARGNDFRHSTWKSTIQHPMKRPMFKISWFKDICRLERRSTGNALRRIT